MIGQAGGEHERPVRRRRQVRRRAGRPSWRSSAPVATATTRPFSSSLYLRCQNSSRSRDDRDLVEVVRGGGRRDHPLEAAGVPRVGPRARQGAPVPASSGRCCRRSTQERDGDDEGADRGHHVPEVEAVALAVGVDAAGHALQAEDVHRAERQVEPDEHQPEVPLAELLVQHVAERPSATRSRCRRRSRRRRRRRARSGSGRRCSTCRSAACRPGRPRA